MVVDTFSDTIVESMTIKSVVIGVLVGYAFCCLKDGCVQDVDNEAANNNTLSEEELIQIRNEMIKENILAKLGMSERPNPSKNVILPRILSTEEVLLSDNAPTYDTSQHKMKKWNVVLFPKKLTAKKTGSSQYTFSAEFSLESRGLTSGMALASLWLYRRQQNASSVVVACKRNISNGFADEQLLHFDPVNKLSQEWMKYDITEVVNSGKITTELIFEVYCKGCDNNSIGTSGDIRPFVVMNLNHESSPSRNRRFIQCTNNPNNHCCRQTYTVNFADIGWDDWIIAPNSYQANYCRGECKLDETLARYRHSQVMQQILQRSGDQTVGLCCNPSKVAGLELLYLVDGVVHNRFIPDMIVKQCDCA